MNLPAKFFSILILSDKFTETFGFYCFLFHQTVFFSVNLALHGVYGLTERDSRVWVTVRNELSTHQRMTIEFDEKAEEGFRCRYVRTCSRPEPVHEEIYANLGLSGRPVGRTSWKC